MNLKLADWQIRVYEEQMDLDIKIGKLRQFMMGDGSSHLPADEKDRLNRQLVLMELYEEVLKDRIDHFTVESPKLELKTEEWIGTAGNKLDDLLEKRKEPGKPRYRWIKFVGRRENGNTHLKLVNGKVVESIGGDSSIHQWEILENHEKILDAPDVIDIDEVEYQMAKILPPSGVHPACHNCHHSLYTVRAGWVSCPVKNLTTLDTYVCDKWAWEVMRKKTHE